MTSKKDSQVTIFFIVGIVIVIVFVVLFLISKNITKKASRQETSGVEEIVFDVQPIKNFVEECLSVVSENGLKILGKQGGYLFKSQGGPLIDYSASDEGLFFVTFENTKVVYNILRPRFPSGKYFPSAPLYPWKTFPYTDETKSDQAFIAEDALGINNVPPLNKSYGANSIQEQLKEYVNNNIDTCLDFSSFGNQGFNISKGNREVFVGINENDVSFRLVYDLTVDDIFSGGKTSISNFLVRHEVRLGKLHAFLNTIIRSDISDMKFDAEDVAGFDDFDVDIKRDIFSNDDLMIVTDSKSTLGSSTYRYIFARKNRNPAMFYLDPAEITLPQFTEITDDLLINPADLQALDPDEDVIDKGDFSITPKTPIILTLPIMKFKVEVTDGELNDYQIITVTKINP
jgi:hypothetical protein